MGAVVIRRTKVAVRSVTGTSGHGPNSIAHSPDQREFLGNTEVTPNMKASSCTALNTNHSRNNDIRYKENTKDGDSPA